MKKYLSINNHNGQGLLKIIPFELGDYLRSEKPNVVTWYNCRGSAGKYVSLLDNTNIDKTKITNRLREVLNSGNELNLSEVVSELEAFCAIFPKGTIHINQYNTSDFEGSDPNKKYLKYRKWYLIFPIKLQKNKEKREYERYKKYFQKGMDKRGQVMSNIVAFTTPSFYDGYDSNLVFTQNAKSLNPEVIKQYESLIQQGQRPYCLVYNSEYSDSDNNYVIDGHHKLMAYHHLNIRPNIVEITQLNEANPPTADLYPLSIDLFDSMYTWQLKHIFDNSLVNNLVLKTSILRQDNRFKQFVKNGFVEEFWVNGQIKSRGNYIDNDPDGKVEHFYENGTQRSVMMYKDGKCLRYIKTWFVSGELQSECVPDGDWLNGAQISYYKTGEVSGKTIFRDGKVADGKSAFTYAIDGRITYEAEYQNGENVRSRWFDSAGNVTEQRGTY